MKICLSCREEYVDRMDICVACKEPLVPDSEANFAPRPKEVLAKEELLKEETIVLTEGALDSCREMENTLGKADIACAVYPVNLGCQDDKAALGTTCATKYMVLVRPSDLERCKEVLEGRFEDQVAKEGMGNYVKHAVDLAQSQIICPACQEHCTLQNGECSSCGLFLGAPN